MRKKVLKFICVFTVIIVTLSCCMFSVSAVQVGDCTLVGTKGQIWNLHGDGQFYDAEVTNNTDMIVYHYIYDAPYVSPIATYSYCSFSGYNYGTLKLSYETYGSNEYGIVFDSFNGLYNENAEKIASFSVKGNTYCLEYTGYIPNEFSVRGYFTITSDVSQISSFILDIQFIPNYSNITNEITQNQDKNTDKILNGDSDLDSSGETDKVDGTIGGIDDATSNAMGGKTDEQIQAEVENSLDPDKIGLDFNKAQRLSVFFDDTLDTFGSSYKALLLLSLSLGLAAFLIGRRYG